MKRTAKTLMYGAGAVVLSAVDAWLVYDIARTLRLKIRLARRG